MRLRLIQLQATVFFRVWNQEEPWFAGDAAPATKDLIARFRLDDVEFGKDVPDSWKPYYRHMLARGLTDLQRVLHPVPAGTDRSGRPGTRDRSRSRLAARSQALRRTQRLRHGPGGEQRATRSDRVRDERARRVAVTG